MRVLKIALMTLAALFAVVIVGVSYLKSVAQARYEVRYEVPAHSIPIPFPLSADEQEALQKTHRDAGLAAPTQEQIDQLALEQAIARGRHYVESRAACTECHGSDFGGKIIIEAPPFGRWVGPNISSGGVTRDYTSEDWVRIIRHGVRKDGKAASMPARDFTWFSDQEISDIAAYIKSQPAVSTRPPESEIGPVLAMLIVSGEVPIDAAQIDHRAKRKTYPPAIEPTLELGGHLATTCQGCHNAKFSGGPIAGGDPSWPPAKNLTFHESGLANWSEEDFTKALRTGLRPDGSKIDAAMPIAYTARLKDDEIKALYTYFRSLPPIPFGQRDDRK